MDLGTKVTIKAALLLPDDDLFTAIAPQ